MDSDKILFAGQAKLRSLSEVSNEVVCTLVCAVLERAGEEAAPGVAELLVEVALFWVRILASSAGRFFMRMCDTTGFPFTYQFWVHFLPAVASEFADFGVSEVQFVRVTSSRDHFSCDANS